jgi:hypothetical protein
MGHQFNLDMVQGLVGLEWVALYLIHHYHLLMRLNSRKRVMSGFFDRGRLELGDLLFWR